MKKIEFAGIPTKKAGNFADSYPEKLHIAEIWGNKPSMPKDIGVNTADTETAVSTDDTMMGNLAKRMQARDFIDATNVGPGKKAKNANLADSTPEKMSMSNAIKTGIQLEKEHTDDVKKARKIAMDHIKELGPNYYKELPKMEKKLKNQEK